MALHNPIEDAQRAAFERNPRGKQALDVARAFLQAPAEPGVGQGTQSPQARSIAQRSPAVSPVRRRPAGPAGGAASPLRTFLGGDETQNSELLSRVIQRMFPRLRGSV